jgi:hypothetical protein
MRPSSKGYLELITLAHKGKKKNPFEHWLCFLLKPFVHVCKRFVVDLSPQITLKAKL